MDTTILIIEDNPTTHKMFKAALLAEGYHVISAFDGASALVELQQHKPHLILQDLFLPDMNYMDLNQKIRHLANGLGVPILALSGFLNKPDENQFKDEFAAFLIKPIEISRLIDVVKSFLPNHGSLLQAASNGYRILIVDDNRTQLKLLQLHLNHQGFEVAMAEDGRVALECLHAYRPDAIISDVLMPNMDGFELCLEIRRIPEYSQIPVLLLTSQYLEELDRDLAKKVGADHYLTRTHDPDQLISFLNESLKKNKPTQSRLVEPVQLYKDEHMHRLIRQLERQIDANAGLSQRCALQFAHLTMLGDIADALTHSVSIEKTVKNLLATCLDAAGISRGALYLLNTHHQMALQQTIGFDEEHREKLANLFHSEEALSRILLTRDILEFPVPEIATGLLAPLIADSKCLGVLLIGSTSIEVDRVDSIAFARNLAKQIGQALVLAQAFERIYYSEQRYRMLMDNASCGIFIFNQKGKLLEVNKQGEKLFNCSKEDILHHDIFNFIVEADRSVAMSALKNLKNGKIAGPTEIRIKPLIGNERIVEYSGVEIKTADESVLMIVVNDVSERDQLKAQARMNDRLAIVGTLAAGVAHEINNPIAWVMNNLVFIKNGMNALKKQVTQVKEIVPDIDLFEMDETINESIQGVQRIRDIVKNLKGFSRRDVADNAPVNLHEILDLAISMASVEFKYRSRLEKQYAENLPLIMGNAGKLQQVFLNLIINASQAMPEESVEANVIRIMTQVEERYIRVDVCDSGHGISSEALPYIFDPFFTTKSAGHGTGLGLSICREIVMQFEGKITVKSMVNQGSTFSVYLPLDKEVPLPAESTAIEQRRKKILIVDDEPYLLKSLLNLLKNQYHVISALGGRLASELLQQHQGEVDAVICDLQMPDMSGADLYQHVSKHYPWLEKRMIFITGGSYTPKLNEFLAGISNTILEKPFTHDELFQSLEASF